MSPKRQQQPDFEEQPAKRTRDDVAQRKAVNKNTSVTVIKSTLNAFCKEFFNTDALRDALNVILKEVNKAVLEAYVLANIHVVRLCSENKAPGPLDQSFFYGCLSAVSRGKKKKQTIKDADFQASVELYNSWKPHGYVEPDSTYLASGCYQNASQQMETMCKNSVEMAFYRRFKRYLKARYNLDGREAYLKLNAINSSDAYDGDDAIIARYRQYLPRGIGLLNKAPHKAMPMQYMFLRYFEEAQQEALTADDMSRLKGLRRFTLIPTKQGFTCSHIKIDKNGLSGLLRRAGFPDLPMDGPEFREAAMDVWHYFFDIDRFETKNRKFAGEILTDGKAVSIVMRKPRMEAAAEEIRLQDFDEVWGLDPGRRDFFTASNLDREVQRCSTAKFYHDAKYKYSVEKVKVWQSQEAELHSELPPKKTAMLAGWEAYVRAVLPKLDSLITFNMRRRVRDLKFRRYIMSQRKMHEICRELTAKAGRRTLIGFGDWSNIDQAGIIKKSPAGPVKRLERRLKQYATVVSVDEYRTSKLHNDCHQLLEHQHSSRRCRDGETRTVKVHSALFCRNKSCHGVTVNRDVNASRNILMLLMTSLGGLPRPPEFSRGSYS
eukprot:jgi/Astpho2/5763/fgenesh1_pg.00080_%23_27_t